MKVLHITIDQYRDWLLYKHYAHRLPNVTDAFGLFENNMLVGICTFGIPASYTLCKGVCGEQHKDKVRELNRLCIDDNISTTKKNITSFFVGCCIRRMNHSGGIILVSFADTAYNHHGYVYQATNWIYTGLTAKHIIPVTLNGKHSRHEDCDKAKDTVQRSRKHRYIYFVGTKKWVKQFKKDLKYPIAPYPKGDNIRYDTSYQPKIQGGLF